MGTDKENTLPHEEFVMQLGRRKDVSGSHVEGVSARVLGSFLSRGTLCHWLRVEAMRKECIQWVLLAPVLDLKR